MTETVLISFTLLLGVFYFSFPKHISGLEQVFMALVTGFIFCSYISIFGDNLEWWKVHDKHQATFKIVEIVGKTFVVLMVFSLFAKRKRNIKNHILSICLYVGSIVSINVLCMVFNAVDYKGKWYAFSPFLYTCTFLFLSFLHRKYRNVLIKEGVDDHEGTTTS
ncbi:hypothetical protein [Peribacillus alkalitolerans]|uniref:hypothetical protein n=1 Tax=Peribacillus alkalitolerans TaxID=1550385 RepID=UPI0013D8D92F|nr:hypothetical protein [Peribacillus alkalitolerans]